MIMYAVYLRFAQPGFACCDAETRKPLWFANSRDTSVVLPVPEAAEMIKMLPFR